jgi:tyrosyl-tRNA synthetase
MNQSKTKLINSFLDSRIKQIINKKSLLAKLKSGKKLIIKHGVDPTTSDLHLGYAVVYHKLRALQDMGHTVVFLIGGFTARFGDPTDKKSTRELRDKTSVEKMAKNYINQAFKILDPKKTEIRYNSEWYDKMSAEELLQLMSKFTYAQMMERDMFKKRMKQKQEIGLHEPVYPVLQGYDSVMLKSDITVIGTDQLFNEMRGRDLQRDFKQAPQDIVTVPLLIGLDGKNKMSQSLNNDILITESAENQFGKIMSLPDNLIMHYWELATNKPNKELNKISKLLKQKNTNPKDIKIELGKAIVSIYHSEAAAGLAANRFKTIFQKKEIPKDIPSIKLSGQKIGIVDFLITSKLVDSKSEARRMLMQRAVRVNQELIQDPHWQIIIAPGVVVQVGKRRFIKIK